MSSTIAIDFILPWTQITAASLQTVFDTSWTADDADDVIVYARGTGVDADDATQLISSSNYTVSFVGTDEDVRVTFSVGRTLDDIVTITRKTPTSRMNLYSNTNFTPSMLNSDFNKLVMMLQERVLENLILPDSAAASTRLSPKYNNSESLTYPNDAILPILTAGGIWRKNDGNTAFEEATIPTYPVGSDAEFTNDNRMVKTDTSGTYNNLQETGISIDDSDVLTGVGGMTVAGITYPTSDGTANQVLETDGAGTLTFSTKTGIVDSVSGTTNEIDVTGTADDPVIGLSSTIVTPGTLTLNADPTTALEAATKQYVDGTVSSTFDGYFNSLILEHTTMTVSSDGAAWTATITGPGTSDLTIAWSTGLETFDATPAASVGLTAGTDSVPVLNYVYIPIGTKTLTNSISGWPASEEFAAVMTVLCQSAATGQTDEPYKVHGWHDDVTESATDKGHSASLNEWIRTQPATWVSGTTLTPTVGVATFDVAVASGIILQLHRNTFPALDTGASAHVNVVNDSVTAYDKVTDLSTLLTDANGVTMSNRRFNMVIWGCVSEEESQCKLFLNLPTASYNNDQGAIDDSDRTSVFTIPVAFRGTGFLIARLSVRHVSSSNTWSILQNEDLRGLSPAVATGSGVGGITAVSDDPAPTLGGNLDGGAFDISNVNDLTVDNDTIMGDPGAEGSGITIGGVTYDSVAKVSNLGGTNQAQFILHRHSTTLAPLIVASRSNSNDNTHSIVTDGMPLFQIFGVGWDGSDYEIAGSISLEVDGTPGSNDMPGRWVFNVTPDGSATPAEAMRISEDTSVSMEYLTASTALYADASKKITSSSVTDTELGYVSGVTSALQTQIDAKLATADAATQAEQETGTATDKYVTPGRQQYHPSSPKQWVNFRGSSTLLVRKSYNTTSVSDNGTGDYTVNIDTDFSDDFYCMIVSAASNGQRMNADASRDADIAVGSYPIITSVTSTGTLTDADLVTGAAFGDQ
jgi:hypothetical protein